MQKKRYIWRVTYHGGQPVEVVAVDKLEAIQEAAKILDQPWTRIARYCDCLQLRKAAKES